MALSQQHAAVKQNLEQVMQECADLRRANANVSQVTQGATEAEVAAAVTQRSSQLQQEIDSLRRAASNSVPMADHEALRQQHEALGKRLEVGQANSAEAFVQSQADNAA